jgi:hypothetical protein
MKHSNFDEFVKSHVSPPPVGGDEGEGENKIMRCNHLSPSPQPSPIKGEGVLGLFMGTSNLRRKVADDAGNHSKKKTIMDWRENNPLAQMVFLI